MSYLRLEYSTAVALGVLFCVGFSLADELPALVLNPASATYDDNPSVTVTDDGTIWMACHAYKDNVDGVTVRRVVSPHQAPQAFRISDGSPVHGPPTIVAASGDRAYCVWATKSDDRWQVLLRHWQHGSWSAAEKLSHAARDAVFPTATIARDGRLLAVWSELVDGTFRIRGCWIGNGRASKGFDISDGSANAYRPVLARHETETWVFWDEYRRPRYSVYGRRIAPAAGPAELVSPPDQHCLTPTALSHRSGLHVAWLRKVDVMGGPGVVSQWHTLHAAVRRDAQWQPIVDEHGDTAAAELTQGLMAQIAPRPVPTGGYLGSRVRPMLAAVGERVWLLWERKTDHRGSTPRVAGDLIGRPTRDGRWQNTVLLHQGHVDYHVVEGKAEPEFTVVASRLPKNARRTYELLRIDPAMAQPFEQDRWVGWSAVELPIEAEVTQQREIEVAGKHFKLYWADLHCHSNLSADAEGETDELNHYARDRAALDVVAFTNNDFYNVPLTQYEYQLNNLFAASHTAEGRFLSLPGYEWTSRIPGVPGASLADPGNWMPPYQNRSYPSHRSVLYPHDGGLLVHFTEVGNDIARLNAAVAQAGGITLSQHPAFKLSGHEVEVGLELTSGWSNYIGQNPELFHAALDDGRKPGGRRLGFVANGDTHRRAPGLSGALTGIYAEKLTVEHVLEALRQRRCFATSGSQIFVDARAGGVFMGQEVSASNGRITLTLHAIGLRAITSATLVRNGEEIFVARGSGDRELKVDFTDEHLESGVHWYYWRIEQDRAAPVLPGNLMTAHGHQAWSSPHWVVVE